MKSKSSVKSKAVSKVSSKPSTASKTSIKSTNLKPVKSEIYEKPVKLKTVKENNGSSVAELNQTILLMEEKMVKYEEMLAIKDNQIEEMKLEMTQ